MHLVLAICLCLISLIRIDTTNMSALLDAVIHSPKVKHTASVIFLHGLGDSGHGWSEIAHQFASKLPHVKFIFPHAPSQPVALNQGLKMPSWYNIYALDESDDRADFEGTKLSASKVNDLIENEINQCSIPSNRIVVAGFSQGGAVSLVTAVCSKHKLAGIAALSAYFPLRKHFDEIYNPINLNTPIWMGHGTSDQVVRFDWGKKSKEFLMEKGYKNLSFNEYPGLGHSANENELFSFATFLNQHLA